MFYRPAHLKGRVNDAWKSLEFKRSDHSLNIYNPTEYYVVFAGLAVDKPISQAKLNISRPENINSYHFLHLAERT